jgi:RNA polymerase sigma-70 factor (ECF subfamily)
MHMSGGNPSGALRDIRTLFREGMLGELSDKQLLERFVNRDDASAGDAFAILLERHGPMVWGVCRRRLSDQHAAADAFQATFLVLVRKAPAVRVHDSLGPWLYGVSRRVAARARATALRRGAREIADVEATAAPPSDPGDAERLAVLDEEIGRLPERLRAAIVLCDLEGLPHAEAARRLGCPIGTVESRLSRGRRRLRDRLIRRGLAPAAAAVWAETARQLSAAMPAALIRQSVKLMASFPAAGAAPAAVAALAEGVIQMTRLAKIKLVAVAPAILILVTAGVAVHGRQQPASDDPPKPAGSALPRKGAEGAAPADVSANHVLAREQLALADKALADLSMRVRVGEIGITDAAFALWGRRKLEALRAAGAEKGEMVAALENYVADLKKQEANAQLMHETAQLKRIDVYEFQYRRREAEIWLNEAKVR